jgi:hydroxyacylglutathione hydrolase
MILQCFPSGPISTNAYVIAPSEGGPAWIIDAPLDCTDSIIAFLKKYSLSAEAILLTHSHWDHIGDLARLQGLVGAKVFVHKEDKGNVELPGSDGLELYTPIQGVVPDGFLEDRQSLTLGALKAYVIHTPGHSPGSVCLHFPELAILFSGDTLFRSSLGRIDLPTSEPQRMWESLKKLAELKGDTKVFPGHGQQTTIAKEPWLSDAEELFS